MVSAGARVLLVSELRALLGDRCTENSTVLEHHSHSESWHPAGRPDVVAFPLNVDEIAAVVRCAARLGSPIVPFGAGSSLEGHVNAVHGGVSLDLSRMNRVLRVSIDDLDATVEAGVTHRQLNRALAGTGAAFWVDPGADATIGGMAATGASGTTAVRYGTMRETVRGLTVVLADGRVVRTGGRARKSSAGYDLTRLFIGSEGTLGVIAEVTVRLFGQPEAVAAAVCGFDTMEGAVATVIATMQLGIPVARIELLDEAQIEAVNRYSRLALRVAPTLLFEFHGTSEASVSEHAQSVQELAAEHGGSGFEWATTTEARAKLWQARHDTFFAARAMRPGLSSWVTDVCVPISALAECILETKRDLQQAGAFAPLVGHAGDGNFHLNFVFDPGDPRELETVRSLNAGLVRRALALGGTCTGEHGIGLGKMAHLQAEHGETVDVMRSIKQALDPANIMNPGKIFN